MSSKPGIAAYKKTDVFTASKETVLLMLYEGAIRFLKSAIEASERKDVAERNRFIGKTQDIVNELSASLNHEVGGELSANLEMLYEFVSRSMINGMMEHKTQPLHDALKVLENLYDGWVKAVETLKQEAKNKKPEETKNK